MLEGRNTEYGVSSSSNSEINYCLPVIQECIGLVSTVGDGWSARYNKQGFFALKGFHIRITKKLGRPAKWSLENAIIGFRRIEGAHDGDNLGRLFMSTVIRAGIVDPDRKISKVRAKLIGLFVCIVD